MTQATKVNDRKVHKVFLAFDPGGTTGVASGFHRGDENAIVLVESDEVLWKDRFRVFDLVIDYYSRARDRGLSLIVVTEDFLPNPQAIASLAHRHVLSAEVIGMIDLACHQCGLTLYRQLPAVRKGVRILDNHQLKVGASPHKQDAYQHFRYKVLEDIRRPQT